jgi:hypothetical protein
MSYLNEEQHKTFIDTLSKDYSTKYKEFEFGGLIPIFFAQCKDSTHLENIWLPITTAIATNYQVNLKDEFPTWNIYIFFVVQGEIPNEIKYKIENDTFSSRKIVIPEGSSDDEIINSHIVNKLQFSVNVGTISQVESFKGNPIIESAVEQKSMNGKRQVTEESREALFEIINRLKKEDNEV